MVLRAARGKLRAKERFMAIPLALARRRNYSGPAIFSYGFRPFFFAAGVWAALGIALWLPQFFGEIALPIAIGPRLARPPDALWLRGCRHRRLSAHRGAELDRAAADLWRTARPMSPVRGYLRQIAMK
jgi:hypothetical protein